MGVLAEIGFGALDYLPVSAAWRWLGTSNHWLGQTAADIGLNVGQAAVSATHGGQFSANEFGQNLEGLPAGLFYARGVAGFGRRTHTLRGMDVARRALSGDAHDVLIFRARVPLSQKYGVAWSSPVLESRRLGLYHEKLVAVSKQHWASRELAQLENSKGNYNGHFFSEYSTVQEMARTTALEAEGRFFSAAGETKYEYVGRIKTLFVESQEGFFHGFLDRDLKIRTRATAAPLVRQSQSFPSYRLLTNNCHHHAYYAIGNLRRLH